MFTVTETPNIDLNTYWEFNPQYTWSEEQLRTQDIKKNSELYVRVSNDAEWGETRNNRRYNNEIYDWFPDKKLFILDIGCGGGGFVEQCLLDGHYAIGVDAGNAYSKLKSFSWKKIPDNLFVRDFGQNLQIQYNNENIKFDIIHSWDCFEHINPNDMNIVMENIDKHSSKQTKVVLQIANWSGESHRNVHSLDWWLSLFNNFNFNLISQKLNNMYRVDEGEFLFILQKN